MNGSQGLLLQCTYTHSPAGSDCVGVDLNRNWPAPGFGVGASDNPCTDIYHGDKQGSQPEVKAAVKNLLKLRERVRASLSVHSYGKRQLITHSCVRPTRQPVVLRAGSKWLIPWGYKNQTSFDEVKMRRLGDEAVRAMEKINGREYEVGAAGLLFQAAGQDA